MDKNNFESFDEGDIVRSYAGVGVLRLFKIYKWVSNDFIVLIDVEKLDKVSLGKIFSSDTPDHGIVIDIDILYEHYTKKGVPENAHILYGDKE